MPESFTLDTSCQDRPIIVTASGNVLEPRSAPAPAADPEADEDQEPAKGGRRARAKVLTPPARGGASTGTTPTAK